MVPRPRKLDPTRIVVDKHPCNYDHVAGTETCESLAFLTSTDHDAAENEQFEESSPADAGSGASILPRQGPELAPMSTRKYGSDSAGGVTTRCSASALMVMLICDLTPNCAGQGKKIQGYI